MINYQRCHVEKPNNSQLFLAPSVSITNSTEPWTASLGGYVVIYLEICFSLVLNFYYDISKHLGVWRTVTYHMCPALTCNSRQNFAVLVLSHPTPTFYFKGICRLYVASLINTSICISKKRGVRDVFLHNLSIIITSNIMNRNSLIWPDTWFIVNVYQGLFWVHHILSTGEVATVGRLSNIQH